MGAWSAWRATQAHVYKKRKLEATKVNIKPGVSAAMEGTYAPTTTLIKAKGDTLDASPAKPDGGVQVNLAKWAAQLEDLEVRGDGKCWCLCCHVVINVTEKSTATKHSQGGRGGTPPSKPLMRCFTGQLLLEGVRGD